MLKCLISMLEDTSAGVCPGDFRGPLIHRMATRVTDTRTNAVYVDGVHHKIVDTAICAAVSKARVLLTGIQFGAHLSQVLDAFDYREGRYHVHAVVTNCGLPRCAIAEVVVDREVAHLAAGIVI